ncbi:YdbL family protein [Candidatus Albibeggiatoa sp. nov. NOAA]|uniref:YdbL family protein n=1 Tax=Candidatus Albibeggiatoa sp. nov. NOAA TaxID=3162724 RepID=UPI0032F79725|nr:YdbL family protein [Thiotrichaceae bacterium]
MRYLRWSWVPVMLIMTACVTINVYFPAAAAEKAADQIIDKVWGEEEQQQNSGSNTQSSVVIPLWAQALDILVRPAQANSFNIDISSPAIQAIQQAMQARHQQLEPFYNNGGIGLTSDALVILRAPNKVPLRSRNEVKKLVDDENNDRLALYREMANANGHPEWESQIRDTFATRWIERAKSGWWYQDADGNWMQKVD